MITAITAAGAWLAAPGAAPAATPIPTPKELATDACHGERADLGKATFRKRYGDHPMKACMRKATRAAREDLQAADDDCTDELAEDGQADFNDLYGEAPDDSDAWTNCILDGLGLLEDDSGDDGD